MDFYFDSYEDLSLQRFMVSDKPRTDAFAAAIAEVVKGGERVLDVGTGTGLLAMLAAKTGAGQVYGVDQASIADLAEKLVEENGLSEKVEIINGNAKNVKLSEPVDILVSEWLGHFAFSETMLDDVLIARDKNLKPSGTMLPSGVELKLAPINDPWLYEDSGPGFWNERVHGIDFSILESLELKQALAKKTIVPASSLLSAGASLFALDLAVAAREDPWQCGEVEFIIEKNGRLDGFVGWFVAQLSPNIVLDTGPAHEPTHWAQMHFPFTPREVRKGQILAVRFALDRHPYEGRSVELKLTVDDETFYYTVG